MFNDLFASIHISVDKELKAQAQEKARRECTTLSAVLYHALKNYAEGETELRLVKSEPKARLSHI